MGWLLVCGPACLAQGSPVEQASVSEHSLQRLTYLTGLLVVLGPLFLWHRSRFLTRKPPEVISLTRAAVVPQFMQWLKSRAVQQLIIQREELVSTQQLAEMELAKLEQMLIEVHAPLQERLWGYEQRIADLEQALKGKGEENRDLIETMIRLTRQKLEAERQGAKG